MSELNEQRWSVLSERGREAERATYADAAMLVRRLTAEKIHGLCVVTDEAAERLAAHAASANGSKQKANKKSGARRRSAKT
jgi:hypothetical protein